MQHIRKVIVMISAAVIVSGLIYQSWLASEMSRTQALLRWSARPIKRLPPELRSVTPASILTEAESEVESACK